MQPSSVGFLVLVSAMTLLAIVATVLTWEWKRFRHVRRILALTVTQFLVVFSVLVAVNAHEDFYVSWGEIFAGEDDVPADDGNLLADASKNKGLAPGSANDQLGPAVAAGQKLWMHRPNRGVMVATTIRGPRTGYSLPARVYLPAAYFDKSQPTRTFPVIEFFPGYVGGVDIFQRRMGADDILDSLIARGVVPPTIVVIPLQNPRRMHDSECVDSPTGDKADTYVSADVPDVVRQSLRVSPDRTQWALLGYSTGGFCAVNLALRHPESFGAAASLSGYFRAVTDRTTGDLYQGDLGLKLANTPKHTISQPRRYPLRFFLFTASQDRDAVAAIKDFAPRVKAPDMAKVMVHKGGHNFSVWIHALPETFTWIGQTFRDGAGTLPGGSGPAQIPNTTVPGPQGPGPQLSGGPQLGGPQLGGPAAGLDDRHPRTSRGGGRPQNWEI